MIRMNRHMQARFLMYTDWLLDDVDPDGLLGLRLLIAQARVLDGGGRFREHDYPALLERLRRNGNSSYSPPLNGVDHGELEAILQGATP